VARRSPQRVVGHLDYLAALNRHLGVAILLADHSPTGPNGAMLRERWPEAMFRNDFPVDTAPLAHRLVTRSIATPLPQRRTLPGVRSVM